MTQTSNPTQSDLSLAREEDQVFFEREIKSFLPDKVFDAHMHLWPDDPDGWSFDEMPPDIGLGEYQSFIEDLHPGRNCGAMVLPAVHGNTKRASQFVSDQITNKPSYRGAMFISPGDDPQWVQQEVRRLGLHGLKCYHLSANVEPTWEADIPDYLPESFVKIADEEGLVITLHMVKSRSVADPSNIHWIRHYCETYPNMKLILAHSARGFQPAHNLEGLPQLTGLDNLYFDTSANCEPIAHEAIIRIIGHDKLMYGSDFPVSHMRGRSLSAGDSSIWLYADTPVWNPAYGKVPPVLIGLEHIRSLKWACWSQKLGNSAVEDIFYNNAARLFGL